MIVRNDTGVVVHREDTPVTRADMLAKKGQLTQEMANFLAEANKRQAEIAQVDADIAAFDALQAPANPAPAPPTTQPTV